MNMAAIRVVLADDHTLVRNGIRALLEKIQGVQVVAEAADGREALELIEAKRPDVALMDINMPGLNGIETTANIKRRFPETRVLILSVHSAGDFVSQALRAGASGYLPKDATPMELEFALRAVVNGETYLSPRVSGDLVDRFVRSAGVGQSPLELLTPRQREILQLVAEGHSTKQIASRLNLSVKTVESHRALLMERLGIHDIAGLALFAARAGLVERDS